ncbi:hypothetical protein Prum_044970 [Phytohabitans rumicis]|uniref:SnoaL-like domain-containing protein n=1 Tax=Phytohabitans rumicis TaxID=1076125 RepID=A0A6V8LDW5_9ACTN|nr:hypothetical protein Prum_044970 [Phytohabitans rumicis]
MALVAYRDATEPDRSAPDVAVDNYLRAYLVERNDTRAGLYTCGGADLAEIRAFRRDIEARESQHAINVQISWGSLTMETSGRRSTVSVEIRRTISDGSESDRQLWRFDAEDDDGWRVCSARRG